MFFLHEKYVIKVVPKQIHKLLEHHWFSVKAKGMWVPAKTISEWKIFHQRQRVIRWKNLGIASPFRWSNCVLIFLGMFCKAFSLNFLTPVRSACKPRATRFRAVFLPRDLHLYCLFDILCSFHRMQLASYTAFSGYRIVWWGRMQHQYAITPKLHKNILCKSLNFVYADLRENKSTK